MRVVNGEYVRVEDDLKAETTGTSTPPASRNPTRWGWKWWLKLITLFLLFGISMVLLLKWVLPLVIDKVVIPFIIWEERTLDPPVLALLIFVSVALFPIFLLPTSPSMWVAGLAFGYGFGCLLVTTGLAIGISLPYMIGSHFHLQVQQWLEKYPEQASVLRLAGEGSWFHQFKAVVLIRLSPFPYVIFNYAVVAANIAYVPYLLGSLVGTAHEVVMSLYSGILIRALAEAADDNKGPLNSSQATFEFNTLGICLIIVAAVTVEICIKARLNQQNRQGDEERSLLE